MLFSLDFLALYFQDAFLQKTPVNKQPWWLAMSVHTHPITGQPYQRAQGPLGALKGQESLAGG